MKDEPTVDRRKFLASAGALTTVGLAGCSGGGGGDGGDGDSGGGGGGDGGGGGGGDGGGGSSDYPDKSLELIIPFSEGGGTDTVWRGLMPGITEELGESVQISNIPGSASLRGTAEFYNSKPDGYTVGAVNKPSGPLSLVLYEPDFLDNDPQNFNKVKGAAAAVTNAYMIVTNKDYDIQGFSDLKERYASGEFKNFGIHTSGIPIALTVKNSLGLEFDQYVEYDGAGPTTKAIASKEIPAGIAADAAALSMVGEGAPGEFVLALYSKGSPMFPDVPSTTDEGLSNMDFLGANTRALHFPPETPDERVQTFADAVKRGLETDKAQQWSKETGQPLKYMGPEATDKMMEDAINKIPEVLDVEKLRDTLGIN